MNPDLRFINIKEKSPIYVSARGPKVAQMAGRIADGVILFGAVSPSRLYRSLQAPTAGIRPRRVRVGHRISLDDHPTAAPRLQPTMPSAFECCRGLV